MHQRSEGRPAWRRRSLSPGRSASASLLLRVSSARHRTAANSSRCRIGAVARRIAGRARSRTYRQVLAMTSASVKAAGDALMMLPPDADENTTAAFKVLADTLFVGCARVVHCFQQRRLCRSAWDNCRSPGTAAGRSRMTPCPRELTNRTGGYGRRQLQRQSNPGHACRIVRKALRLSGRRKTPHRVAHTR